MLVVIALVEHVLEFRLADELGHGEGGEKGAGGQRGDVFLVALRTDGLAGDDVAAAVAEEHGLGLDLLKKFPENLVDFLAGVFAQSAEHGHSPFWETARSLGSSVVCILFFCMKLLMTIFAIMFKDSSTPTPFTATASK